ncbi:MAG: hypothetical protein ACRDHW_13915, partial [Ktedonobacteraceae bacterium]
LTTLGGKPTPVLPNVSCTEETSLGDPVFIQLCKNRQLVEVNQTRIVGDYTLTLQRAYVDANQLLFEYNARQISTGKAVSLDAQKLDVILQNTSDSISLNHTGINSAYGRSGDLPIGVAVLNIGAFPQNLRAFNLHIIMHSFHLGISTGPTDQRPVVQGDANFGFSLPFHPGQTINPAQSIMVNGQTRNTNLAITANGTTYMLYQIVITPSMISLYTTGILSDKLSSYALAFNGQEIQANSEVMSVSDSQKPHTVFAFETPRLFHQHGTLTLSVNVNDDLTNSQILLINLP